MKAAVIILHVVAAVATGVVAKRSPDVGLCPDKCECREEYPLPRTKVSSLTVACSCDQYGRGHLGSDIDREKLTEQLDALLSSYLAYGHLTSLSITCTPLTHVPSSVCRLTTLTRLQISNSRLTRLPDNCLTNLTSLTQLDAHKNNISELQDELFDGLQKLQSLRLDQNLIASIGLKVFNSSAMLTSLKYVNLASNKLTVVEPWVYFVAINGKQRAGAGRPHLWATVLLHGNYIENFTNAMGLKLKCGMQRGSLLLDLNVNKIKHISDMLKGWNTSITTLFCLNGDSRISFGYNDLDCDCVDYDIYKLVFRWTGVDILDDVHCRTPDNLFQRRVNSIPLVEFICELTEQCPPGCRCVHRPANATLHVYCSNSNITALPHQLPELPKSYTKYKLDFSNNRLLRGLEHRSYFVNTSILDVSNCGLETVENWKNLLSVKYVYLHGNRLSSLPREISALNVSTQELSLYNNPWRCRCNDTWFSKWLNENGHLLLNPSDILCSYPQRLTSRSLLRASDQFCSQAESETNALAIGMPTSSGAVVVLLVAGLIVYRLRIRLYTRWKFHPFDRDEGLGETLYYDVFLSCSSDDNLPHGNGIREQLEDRGYRVCYPPKDFLPGIPISENVYNAVVLSKRTVCFLTPNFIQSSYCMVEFETALHHNIMVKRKKRLIVLMALDSPSDLYANDASDTAVLRQYLRQYTYIDYTADDWLDKLLYALPVRGLLQTNQDNNDDARLLPDISPDTVLDNRQDILPLIN